MLAGLSNAVESWKKGRDELVKKRKASWKRLLKKYSHSSDAMWLLANPIPTKALYPDPWENDPNKKRAALCKPFVDKIKSLLTHHGAHFTDQDLLNLEEAFPVAIALPYALEHRHLSPTLLRRHKVVWQYENGLLEIQSHLKKLPLDEQVEFMGSKTNTALIRLLLKLKPEQEGFYTRILEDKQLSEIIRSINELEVILVKYFYRSIRSFTLDNGDALWLLDRLNSDNAKLINELLSFSDNHGKLIKAILKFARFKDKQIDEAQSNY